MESGWLSKYSNLCPTLSHVCPCNEREKLNNSVAIEQQALQDMLFVYLNVGIQMQEMTTLRVCVCISVLEEHRRWKIRLKIIHFFVRLALPDKE